MRVWKDGDASSTSKMQVMVTVRLRKAIAVSTDSSVDPRDGTTQTDAVAAWCAGTSWIDYSA